VITLASEDSTKFLLTTAKQSIQRYVFVDCPVTTHVEYLYYL